VRGLPLRVAGKLNPAAKRWFDDDII